MRDIRFRLDVSLDDLLIEGRQTLNIKSDPGLGIPYEGTENVLHNFVNHYKFLPLTKISFSRATVEGEHLVEVEPPDYFILVKDRKGYIVNVKTDEQTVKFFVLDESSYEPIQVIKELLSGLGDIGLKVKKAEIGVVKPLRLSDALSYMITSSRFTTAEDLRGLNAEPSEVIRLDVVDDFSSTDGNIRNTVKSIQGNPNEPIIGLGKVIDKILENGVFPFGEVKVDYGSQWFKELNEAINNSGGKINVPVTNKQGFLIDAVNLRNGEGQRFYVNVKEKDEAGGLLKAYLQLNMAEFKWEFIRFDYVKLGNPQDIVSHVLSEITYGYERKQQSTPLEMIAEDKGSSGVTIINKEGKNITTDFFKKD